MEVAAISLIVAIASPLLAIFGSYTATKRAAEDRERDRDKAQAVRDRHVAESIARIEAKFDLLTKEVEKHNGVIERTYKLETEVDNLYHRYDELRADMKIGGTD